MYQTSLSLSLSLLYLFLSLCLSCLALLRTYVPASLYLIRQVTPQSLRAHTIAKFVTGESPARLCAIGYLYLAFRSSCSHSLPVQLRASYGPPLSYVRGPCLTLVLLC